MLRGTSYPTCLDHFWVFQDASKHFFSEKVQLQLQLAVLGQDDTLRSTLRMLKDQDHRPAKGPKIPRDLKFVEGDESWRCMKDWFSMVLWTFRNPIHQTPGIRFHTTASSDSSLGVVQKASSDNTIHVRQTDNIVPTCTNIFWKQKLEQSMQNTRGPSAVSASFSYVPWSKDRLDYIWFIVIHSMLGLLTMGI